MTKKVSSIPRKSALPVEGITPYTPTDGEEYMSEPQMDHFKKILVAWKSSLQEEAKRTFDHLKEEVSHLSDPSDRATQEEEFALELRTRDREGKLIRKINKTLARLDDGDYGYCDACGIEIGLQRLEVRPTAEMCIDCKSTQEIKERQLAS